MNTERTILATLASVGAGVLIGILVAPEKGAETRKKLSEKSNDYLNDLKSEFKELSKTVNKKVNDTKDELKKASKRGKEKVEETGEEIKEKVNQ